MKIRSLKPKGSRMFKSVTINHTNHQGYTKKTKRPLWIEPERTKKPEDTWWFCLEEGEWQQEYNGKGGMSSSYYAMEPDGYHSAYSIKAARRLISGWNVPKGTVFRVSLPYVGHEFKITKP